MLVSFFDEEPKKPLDLDDYANFVERCIDKVEAKKVILVGHSFGGRVALRLSSRGIGDKLVLVDSAGLKPRRSIKYYLRVFAYKIRKLIGLDTSKYGSQDYKSLSPIMKKTFVNIVNTYQDYEMEYVKVPTLIIWGEKDNDTPLWMAKKLYMNIKNSTLLVYKNSGHFSYLEKQEQFIRNLRSFIG